MTITCLSESGISEGREPLPMHPSKKNNMNMFIDIYIHISNQDISISNREISISNPFPIEIQHVNTGN